MAIFRAWMALASHIRGRRNRISHRNDPTAVKIVAVAKRRRGLHTVLIFMLWRIERQPVIRSHRTDAVIAKRAKFHSNKEELLGSTQ